MEAVLSTSDLLSILQSELISQNKNLTMFSQFKKTTSVFTSLLIRMQSLTLVSKFCAGGFRHKGLPQLLTLQACGLYSFSREGPTELRLHNLA